MTPAHVEDQTQRATLIAAFSPLATAALQTTNTNSIVAAIQASSTAVQPVSASALPLPAGAATATGVAAVVTALGGTLQVSGPLTQAQLTSAALATSALQTAGNTSLTAIQTAVAGTLKVDTVVQATSVNRGATVGTTASNLMAANASRRGFSIQNQHASANIYISGVGTATADYNCFMIPAGGYYETPPHHAGTGAVSIISSAASTPVYSREW
jgi:hypothetical protein